MKKRLLSIALCLVMIMTLLPAMSIGALAIPGPTRITVRGVTLNAGKYLANDADAPVVEKPESGGYVYFSESNNKYTLTLHNANITGAVISNCKYGIDAEGDLIINLEGENTVSAGDSTDMNNFGIYATGALTIRGDGSLSVSSGTVSGDTSLYYSTGIYAANGITIESGTITAMGGTTNGQSYGIESSGDIDIRGGAVTAVGGSGDDACGIYVALANGALDISGSAHVTAVGGRADSSAASSHGIFVNNEGDVTIRGSAVVTAVGGSATNSASVTTASHGIRGDVTLSDNALLTAVGGDAGSWSYGVGGNFTYNGGVFAARGGYYDASFHDIKSMPLRESPTLNNTPRVLGECNTKGSYYVLEPAGGSSIYHVAVDNVTSEDTVDGHITWNGNDCTLNNTVLVAADDQYNNNALTIPDGGDLTCEGVNVVLGIEAHGILIGGDADAAIDGSGTLTAIGGVSFSSQNPGYGIMANGNLTLAGPGRICAIGSNCSAHPGCAIGLADYSNDNIFITGGSGMAVNASSDDSAFFPTGRFATLLGGAWDGRAVAWRAATATKAITAFSIGGAAGTIDEDNHAIAVTVPYGTDVTSLTPSITHTGASVAPAEAQDFTSPVTYTVTAENGGTQDYTVTVTAAAAPVVATPVARPAAGTYTSAQSVTLTSTTDGATIYYTFDPLAAPDIPYTAPISVSESRTIRAQAKKAGCTDSGILTAVYTIDLGGSFDSGDYTPPLVTEIKNDGSVTGSNLDRLISENKELTVTGYDGAKLVLSTDALKGVNAQTSGNVKVKIEDVSKEHQDTHAGKTVYALTVTSGDKTVSDFGGSVTVSLPYELKGGEKAEDVAVWYLAPDKTMTELPCTYNAKAKLATFTVTHFSEYVVGVKDWVNPFSDVKETDWFYGDVAFVHAAGMMNGTGDTTFDSHGATTRGMLVTILYRLEGSPNMENESLGYPFADVDAEAYYGTAVYWARLNRIVDGYDTEHFGPNDSITREQLATILYRYAQYKGYKTDTATDTVDFADAGKVSSYAVSAIQWACGAGLIQGSDGKLMPQGNAERCQVAAILHRFCEDFMK